MNDKVIARIGVLLLLGVLLLHLPFITADPDVHLSTSRDAFTDEGLNTSQLRSYINHGKLDMMEGDNLVKTPFFNLILLIPFKIFGTHLEVARITILLLLFTVLFFHLTHTYFSKVITVLSLTVLFQYYIFQYSHFSLSEMLSVTFILAGIFQLFLFLKNNSEQPVRLFLASLCIALSYYSKIQFVYISVLIPFALFFVFYTNRKCQKINKRILQTVLISIAWMLFFMIIYLTIWYLPHSTFFEYVLKEESQDKYAAMSLVPRTIAFNVVKILFGPDSRMINLLLVVSFFTGCFLWRQTDDRHFKLFFVISICWVFIELHKLTMVYLPARYLVSYYFAGGLLASIVISHLIFGVALNIKFRAAGYLLLLLFLITNSISYYALLTNRQYNIHNINNYFATTLNGEKDALVLGPWAPSLTWESKVISKPVWYHFMNDENILQQKPRLILSEPDEAESNLAYQLHQMQLADHADSVIHFKIGNWKVNAYWMKQE